MIVINTDPLISTEQGGNWWDVAVPEVNERAQVRDARAAYETARKDQIKSPQDTTDNTLRHQPHCLDQ